MATRFIINETSLEKCKAYFKLISGNLSFLETGETSEPSGAYSEKEIPYQIIEQTLRDIEQLQKELKLISKKMKDENRCRAVNGTGWRCSLDVSHSSGCRFFNEWLDKLDKESQ